MIDHNGSVKIIGFAVDAALHGLPPGRQSTDIVDLAGILYATLVGKWPGISRSRLPSAPMENGHPLRPRRVRAGIPKPLDTVCEQILSPFSAPGTHARAIESAADIRDALTGFVGDPGELANGGDTGPIPKVPAFDDTRSHPPADSGVPDEAVPDAESTQAMAPPLDPTWLDQRTEPPPPPPELEHPTPKPLFAEDSVRRPRPQAEHPSGSSEYWPWAPGDPGAPGATGGSSTGTGGRIKVPEEPVPGRSWLRLAWGLFAVLLLLVAVAFAFSLGRDRGKAPDDPGATRTTDEASVVQTPVSADDFDPQGKPPEENPEQVDNVLDGNARTTWQTNTYDQQLGPGGLKTGVGLLLDLGADKSVSAVEVALMGSPTSAELYVTTEKPTGVNGLTPVASGTATGTELTLTPGTAVEGRYVLVWLTALPHPAGYRGVISDIVVRS